MSLKLLKILYSLFFFNSLLFVYCKAKKKNRFLKYVHKYILFYILILLVGNK